MRRTLLGTLIALSLLTPAAGPSPAGRLLLERLRTALGD